MLTSDDIKSTIELEHMFDRGVANLSGAFQTSREIFSNSIWRNIVEFRLFFLIYGHAVFKDDIKLHGMNLKRGQWVRSYRNLQGDLEYIENRSVKRYSLSVLKRAIDSLVKDNRLKIEGCELGTLFEVVNYAKYQGLDNYKTDNENGVGTEMEQGWNGERTEKEQHQNNKKKEKNVKKEKNEKKDIYCDLIFGFTTDEDLQKAIQDYIDMRIKKGKAPTTRALELVFKTLDKFDPCTQKKMLEKSTVNDWTDVFPLKEQEKSKHQSTGNPFLDKLKEMQNEQN
jgi:hypothetical protein